MTVAFSKPYAMFNRHSPDARGFRGQNRAPEQLAQRQTAIAMSKGRSKPAADGDPPLKR